MLSTIASPKLFINHPILVITNIDSLYHCIREFLSWWTSAVLYLTWNYVVDVQIRGRKIEYCTYKTIFVLDLAFPNLTIAVSLNFCHYETSSKRFWLCLLGKLFDILYTDIFYHGGCKVGISVIQSFTFSSILHYYIVWIMLGSTICLQFIWSHCEGKSVGSLFRTP